MKTYARFRPALLFGVAGAIAFAVDVVVTTTLIHVIHNPLQARIPAFLLAASVTWAINRRYAFKGGKKTMSAMLSEFALYLSTMSIGALINFAIFLSVITAFGKGVIAAFAGIMLGTLISMYFNYFGAKRAIQR